MPLCQKIPVYWTFIFTYIFNIKKSYNILPVNFHPLISIFSILFMIEANLVKRHIRTIHLCDISQPGTRCQSYTCMSTCDCKTLKPSAALLTITVFNLINLQILIFIIRHKTSETTKHFWQVFWKCAPLYLHVHRSI